MSWTQQQSFERFTTGIATWWPLRSHSVGGENAQTVLFEPRVGGEIVEKIGGGKESLWGTVLEWDPPAHFAITWHPGRERNTAQRVDVHFVPDAGATRVELTHSGWEAMGKLAKVARRGYPMGWAYVLRLYADRRWSPVVVSIGTLQWLLQPLAKRLAEKEGPMVVRPQSVP
ncbi:MAG: SRPBCC domain-containing protein [Gemmatimonadaceae bacterium]